ncbi:hypothetical protein X961_5940 [Burkholderia pseudomallei MSHR5613]|nr:hypothetical protein X948_5707 [Burkholderia pseudomallei MSHR5608]KGS19445.1 hypothetical protein X962_5910 [Burkholderia pseudomallei MSHR7343]KGS38178.1 hypothetical protein X961_5940 [Burkholderia pseudomallei MSHR5613]KGS72657.1 hypothetical protein X942_6031 [Burkholderia pseudomallei MSHR5596]KGS73293.1 hypothetical protein X947_5860 [Burkholderia pseudomallei MSHR7334]KGW37912.1 hypothetical protein Y047_6175 [Burkholderia pseudomallei MSHR3016]KGX50567.1 hypothetical protein Y024_
MKCSQRKSQTRRLRIRIYLSDRHRVVQEAPDPGRHSTRVFVQVEFDTLVRAFSDHTIRNGSTWQGPDV